MDEVENPNPRNRRIILVCHGRPVIDEKEAPAHWTLSEAGRDAATALAQEIKTRGAFVYDIMSSSETKALQTAEILATCLDSSAPVVVDANFSEHGRQHTDFRNSKDFETDIIRLFTRSPHELVFGDETADAAVERFAAGLQRWEDSSTSDITVVTHGRVLSLYMGRKLGVNTLEFWRALKMPAAIIICNGQWEMIEAAGAASR